MTLTRMPQILIDILIFEFSCQAYSYSAFFYRIRKTSYSECSNASYSIFNFFLAKAFDSVLSQSLTKAISLRFNLFHFVQTCLWLLAISATESQFRFNFPHHTQAKAKS